TAGDLQSTSTLRENRTERIGYRHRVSRPRNNHQCEHDQSFSSGAGALCGKRPKQAPVLRQAVVTRGGRARSTLQPRLNWSIPGGGPTEVSGPSRAERPEPEGERERLGEYRAA